MSTKLIIVVPAYNETDTITQTVKALQGLKHKFLDLGVNADICVINDGSVDDTGELAVSAGADKVLTHTTNLGLGAAVRTGLSFARDGDYEIMVKFDADLQHDPLDIIRLIQPIVDDKADIVYGNRFERIDYKMPIVRKIGNRFFSAMMNKLTGWPIKDSQPGIFAVNKSYLDISYIPGNYNYTQQVLLDAYHNGFRFSHVSVAFHKRETGKSFISLKYPFKVFPQILMVVASVKPMKIFIPIGTSFILLSLLIASYQIAQWIFGDGQKPIQNVNLVLGSFLFGMQTVFFGVLAQLIVQFRSSRPIQRNPTKLKKHNSSNQEDI